MGAYPRWIKEGSVYSITQRTVDRMFLFLPSPVLRNIVGACAARALARFPVRLYWLDVNINHEHMGIGPMDGSAESLTNVTRFKQLYHRLLAEKINRLLGREGSIFSSASRDTECLDDEAAAQQLFYAMTNPVKDGLVERAAHWQGFSSYTALALGIDEAFTYIDRTAWHKTGKKKGKEKEPEAFTKSIHLHFTPLPGMAHLSEGQRQSMIRRHVRDLEQHFRDLREQQGLTAMSKARLEKLDYRDRPTSSPKKTAKPLCHASTAEAALAYKDSFKIFLDAYRTASASYRLGCADVVFPSGSFKPPLIEAAA